jgi:predicted Zn-dependent protease
MLADLQLGAGRVEDAVATARAVLAADPGEPRATRVLVFALLTGSAPDAARMVEVRDAISRLDARAPEGLREFLDGRVHLANADPAQAAAKLRAAQASAAFRDDAFAALCLGEALCRCGATEEGLVWMRRAVVLPGAMPAARLGLAARLLEASRAARLPQTADRLAREALQTDPESADAAMRVAELASRTGGFADAAKTVEARLALGGLAPEALHVLRRTAALMRLSAGDAERALAHLDAMDAAERDAPLARVALGWALLGTGRVAEAEAKLAALLGDPEVGAQAALGLLSAGLQRGDVSAAAQVLADWRAGHPDDVAVGLAGARILGDAGRHDEAVGALRACAAARPDDAQVSAALVDALGRARRGAEAVAAAAEFAARAGESDRGFARLVEAEARLSHANDAESAAAIARATAASASSGEALVRRARAVEAQALLVAGRAADAEAVAAEVDAAVVGAEPSRPDDLAVELRAKFVLGTAALQAGRAGAAAKHLARCVEIDPRNRATRNNLATALILAGDDVARALDIASKLTAEDPGNWRWWDARADAEKATGDPVAAAVSWRRALALGVPDPDCARVKVSLAEVLTGETDAPEARRLAREAMDATKEPEVRARAARLLSK